MYFIARTVKNVEHIITDNIPSTLGALQHIRRWLFSELSNITHENPHFHPEAVPPGISNKGVKIFFVPGTADKVSSGVPLGQYLKDILFDDLNAEAKEKIDASNLKAILNFLAKSVSSIHLLSFSDTNAGIGIDDFAQHLLEELIAADAEQIFLVGHSRAGLVNAYLIENILPKVQEERLKRGLPPLQVLGSCNICSPFGGSYLAIKLFSWLATSIKQMIPGCDFLSNLAQQVLQSTTKYFFIAAEKDFIVPVKSSYIKGHPQKCKVFEKEGHLSIMSSPAMFEHVLKCLLESYQHLDCLNEQEAKSLSLCLAQPFSQSLTQSLTDSLSQSLSKTFGELTTNDISVQNDENFIITDYKASVALTDAIYELGLGISILKNTFHIKSSADKIVVLETLQKFFTEIITQQKIARYHDANTIDAFIEKFLADKEIIPGKTPLEVLSEPLNYPFYSYLTSLCQPIFSLPPAPKPASKILIEDLISRFHNIAIFSPATPTDDLQTVTTVQYTEIRCEMN